MGGCSIDAHGTALTDEVLEACRAADAVLLGAVGGPKWDTTDPDAPRPEQGLLGLRKGMGLYANLRPVRPSPALVAASPLREERIAGTDLLVVRELTGGIYFGDSGRDGDVAHDTCEYSVAEIERIARAAFEAARRRAEGAAAAPRHLGRQGQRARDLAALARGGRPGRRRLPRRRARPPAGRQRGDAARLPPGRVRRDRHREPLRRHPQRRVGDADRLAGDAALGQPRRGRRAGPVRARPRLRPRHRRPGRSPTRSPPSSPRRCCCATASTGPTTRPGSRPRSTPCSSAACAPPTSPRRTARGAVGTAEMTEAVLGATLSDSIRAYFPD